MPTSTSLSGMNWTGDRAQRFTYLRMVKISANSLGRFAMRIFNGEKASVENVPLAWAVYCSLAGTTRVHGPTTAASPGADANASGEYSVGQPAGFSMGVGMAVYSPRTLTLWRGDR